MTTDLEIALVFGAIGALLTVVSNLMKRMTPLRAFAIAANSFLIVYASIEHNWINCGLQVALLAVNAYRLWDLRRLVQALEHANTDRPVKEWLLPHMKRRKFKAGTALFNKGDIANQLFYIRSGTVRFTEFDRFIGPGNLIGEIGLFSEDRKRPASVVCETDCVCYTMTDEAMFLLFAQSPMVGFYLIRLIVQRLLHELERRPLSATA